MSARDYKSPSDLVLTPTNGGVFSSDVLAFHSNAQPDQMRFDPHVSASLTCSQTAAIVFSCKDHGADAAVEIAPTMRAMGHSGSHANAGGQLAVCITGDITHTLKAEGFDASEDGTGRGQPIVAAFKAGQGSKAGGIGYDEYVAPTLSAADSGTNRTPAVMSGMAVRRLTPVECERLQGFPDGYTDIPWTEYQRLQKRAEKQGTSFEEELRKHGKVLRGPEHNECPDGPRYKALGNSWAVPKFAWLGARIDAALKASA